MDTMLGKRSHSGENDYRPMTACYDSNDFNRFLGTDSALAGLAGSAGQAITRVSNSRDRQPFRPSHIACEKPAAAHVELGSKVKEVTKREKNLCGGMKATSTLTSP